MNLNDPGRSIMGSRSKITVLCLLFALLIFLGDQRQYKKDHLRRRSVLTAYQWGAFTFAQSPLMIRQPDLLSRKNSPLCQGRLFTLASPRTIFLGDRAPI